MVKGVDTVKFRRTVPCPACSKPVEMSRHIFRSSFVCPHCGIALKVSLSYVRFLAFLGFFLGFATVWKVSRICPPSYLLGFIPTLFVVLGIPIGYLFLIVFVRVAPLIVKPKLVLEWPREFTTLSLTARSEDEP